MIISIIAAVGNKRALGFKNQLPWKLPADLEYFRFMSQGKPIVMGEKTFESIGKPLPHRQNIVLSRNPDFKVPGCLVASSIEEALKLAEDSEELMVGGGATIYQQFLPLADKMYLTFIHHNFEADVFFPEYDLAQWKEVSREDHLADEKNPYDYSFVVLARVKD